MNIDVDAVAYDEFMVLDESDNPVTGLVDGNFTRKLVDPDDADVANISAGIPVTITEIEDGLYRVSFTPNKLGNWTLIVYNATYFPFGKGASYKCVEYVIDEIGTYIRRLLGLSQENMRILNQTYDRNNNLIGALIKTYVTADNCENDTNPMAQYSMSAVFDRNNRLTGYKTKRIA